MGPQVGVWPSARRATRTGSSQRTCVAVVRDASEILAYRQAWESLAAQAMEPNPFYEPWMLLPALRLHNADRRVKFLLMFLWNCGDESGSPLLGGLFPFVVRREYRGIPVRVLSLWRPEHCFLCTPLIHSLHARACVGAMFDWLQHDADGCALAELGTVPAEGPVCQLIIEQLRRREIVSHTPDLHTRAFWRPRNDGESYLQLSLSAGRRRNLKRWERQLAAQGCKLEYQILDDRSDADAWIEEFLGLEARGWKGRQGTALCCSAAGADFFRSVAKAAQARGRLKMMALRLNGRAIAMRTLLLAGKGAFLFKPAYDEEYARFGPGVLLTAHLIRHLHDCGGVSWADSCCSPEHALLKEFLLDRRAMQTLLVSNGGAAGDLLVASLPLLHWLRRISRRSMPGDYAREHDREVES